VLAIAANVCISGACPFNENQSPFKWVIGTNIVYLTNQVTGYSGGHWAEGTVGYTNDPDHTYLQYVYRTDGLAGPAGSVTNLNAVPTSPVCTALGIDSHPGWQAANSNDTTPFQSSHFYQPVTVDYLPPFDPQPCPWVDEIDMFQTNGSAGAELVYREALTFNTEWGMAFDAQQNIVETSPSGKLACLGTDWWATLGNSGGTSNTCIPGGPKWLASRSYPLNYVIVPVSSIGHGVSASMIGSTATFTGTFAAPPSPLATITATGFSVSGYNTTWVVLTANSTTITATCCGLSGLANATGGSLALFGVGNNAYKATVSGTSGTNEPNWVGSCGNAGTVCTDGGVTWLNLGPHSGVNACRSDVVCWQLQ
jgi:hypothetical protein